MLCGTMLKVCDKGSCIASFICVQYVNTYQSNKELPKTGYQIIMIVNIHFNDLLLLIQGVFRVLKHESM